MLCFSMSMVGMSFSDPGEPVLVPYILHGEVDARLVRWAMQGIQQNFNMELDHAQETFQRMIDEFPQHPSGYMCMAGLLGFRMEMERSNEHQKQFDDMVKSSLQACKREEREGRAVSAFFFRGGTLGYRGYDRARRKNFLAAVRDGQGMARSLRQALKLDPFCYDAYFGLGLYEYYASKYKSKLDFLPFIGDKREEGIKALQVCIERAPLTAIPARAFLMRIYYEEERYNEACVLARWFMEHCPGYWDAYSVKGSSLRKLDRPQEACLAYRAGIEVLDPSFPQQEYEQVRIHMKLAETLEEMDSWEEAIVEYSMVVRWIVAHPEANTQRIDRIQRKAQRQIQRLQSQREEALP